MENKNNANWIGFIILGILALVVIGFVLKAVIDTKHRESVAREIAERPFEPVNNKPEKATP